MAAILCNGIGSCCECVCTAPFKLCDSGCRGCSKACSSLCNGLCGSPLSVFVIVTVATQLPVAIVSAMELGSVFRCQGSDWLLGTLLVALVHISVAFYLSYRVTNGTDEKLRDRHTSWERISFLLCHDPLFAIYILIYLFFIAWLCVGSVWSIQDKMDTSTTNACGNDIESNVGIVLGLDWAYFFIGPSVLSCILCCTCFSKKDYAATDAEFASAAAAAAAAAANNNDNSNNANDIESPPNNNPSSQSEPKTKEASKPPRTYSVDGVPIDDNDNHDVNNQDRKSSSNAASAIPEVLGKEIPPPVLPPSTAPHSSVDDADVKATVY